jgi:hypothetical protein
VIEFRTASLARNGPPRDYRGDADFFAVYCHSRGDVYLVPVEDCPSRGAHLRLEPARNRQRSGVRMASDYLLTTDAVPRLRVVTPKLRLDLS